MFVYYVLYFSILTSLYVAVGAVMGGEELHSYRPIHERPQCALSFYFKQISKFDARHATGSLVHPRWVLTGYWQFSRAGEIDHVNVRCGSLCLFEGGTQIRSDGIFKNYYKEFDKALQVTLVRLAVPYKGIHSGTSDLAFVAAAGYMPAGTNEVTNQVEHTFIAGFQGLSTNWVGHRIRSMRVRFVHRKECGLIYHNTEYSIWREFFNCYTEAGCTLSWWSWWPWAWKSCPSRITTEKYDDGAGTFPFGTNIVTSVIQTTHAVKYDEKLPMGTNIQWAQPKIVATIRAFSPDDYANWPEFVKEGVQ